MASYQKSSARGKGFYTNAGGISSNIDTESLLKTLRTLPINIQKNVMVGAIRAGANIVRDEARRLVPVDTGNLKKSISTVRRSSKDDKFSMVKSNPNFISFSVTPVKGNSVKYDGWYAHFLEFGTSNMSAKPFLRPAFESKQDEVLQATKEYIANRLPNEVEKAKR